METSDENLIEGYVIEKKVGEGGMASVYKARQKSMNRVVALKVMSAEQSLNPDAIQRFFREIEHSGAMNHPNIVQGYDSGTSGGRHYLALEFISGQTVQELLDSKGRMKENDALKVALGVAKALEFAHKNKIVHRDVKPDNIMVGEQGQVKLTDLGVAQHLEDARLTQVGMAVGTPYYLSPEQASAQDKLDTRSDLYSLGVTLFHMLTGELPFDGPTIDVILTKHVVEFPRSVIELVDDLSLGCDDLVTRLLAKKPKDRYQTPTEVVETIEAMLAGRQPKSEGKFKKLMDRLKGQRDIGNPVLLEQNKIEHFLGADHLKGADVTTVQKQFPADTVVFYEGQDPEIIYLLLEGQVEIILAGKVIYKVEKDGQYFGEVSALKKLPRDHTARTVVDSIIVELSLDQYLKVLRNSPSLSMELIGRLGDLLASQDKDQMASKSSSSAKA